MSASECGVLKALDADVRVPRLPFIAHISCLPHFCQLPFRHPPAPCRLSDFPIFAFANENEIFNKNDSRCFHCDRCCSVLYTILLYIVYIKKDICPTTCQFQFIYKCSIYVLYIYGISHTVPAVLGNPLRSYRKISSYENCRLPIAPKPDAISICLSACVCV